jgi:hypothetical protein
MAGELVVVNHDYKFNISRQSILSDRHGTTRSQGMGDRRRKKLLGWEAWWGMDQIANRDTVSGSNGGKGGVHNRVRK